MAHTISHLTLKSFILTLAASLCFSLAGVSSDAHAETKRKPAQSTTKKKVAKKASAKKKPAKKAKKSEDTFDEAPTETVTRKPLPPPATSKATQRGEKDVRRDIGVSFWIWQEMVEGERQNVTFEMPAQHKDLVFSYFWRKPAKFSKLWRHLTGTGLILGQVDAKGGVFDPVPPAEPEEQFRDQLHFGAYYLRGLIMRTSLQTELIFFSQVMARKTNWGIESDALLEEVRELYPVLVGFGIKLNYDFNFGGSLSFGLNFHPQNDTTMWQFDLTI